jgi:GAF domain-containing protein
MNDKELDVKRINDLKRYDILDTPPDGCFDKITLLAARVFNVPIALITLVDEDRIWFKSKYGLEKVNEIARDPGLCASAILSDEVYLVEDARKDPRTLSNPLVAGDFGLQFYAAAPLISSKGYRLGTICLLDTNKRYLNTDQQEQLRLMADIVMDEMEIRLRSIELMKEVNPSAQTA